ADDGIRDFHVTGVQTCALPIFDIQSAGGVVVQEEQGFRTAHNQVIDAHGHQVDADGVVFLHGHGQLQLGADAVGGRYQHRAAIAGGNLAKRAESAEAGQHFGTTGALGDGLDLFDQCIACVDVDSGV